MTSPDPRCPQHLDNPATYPCRPCADAAEAYRDWKAVDDAEQARKAREARNARLTDRERDIANCALCDDKGHGPTGLPCLHDPQQVETNRRGAELCRTYLGGTDVRN